MEIIRYTRFFENTDITETQKFKEWFYGSKVVNEKKEPLLVYHGTKNNFDSFDNSYMGSSRLGDEASKVGFFFSPQKEEAKQYGSIIISAYLKIKNPLRVDQYALDVYINDWLHDLENDDPEEYDFQMNTKQYQEYRGAGSMKGLALALTDAKNRSNDGVIYFAEDDMSPYINYIVFDKNQIEVIKIDRG